MKFSRHTRKLLALFGAGIILFAQFAMAAHACMVMAPAQAMSAAAPMDAGESPPCHEADPGDLNACVTHCQAGVQQTFDSQPAPSIGLARVFLRPVETSDLVAAVISAQSYAHTLLTRVTAPPAMVRNCCLRT